MKLHHLVLSFLVTMLAACHPTSRDVRLAARDALENASIQLDSGNKAVALQLFKDAEHYGLLAHDTLTVAHAKYHIAQCLGYYADKEEVVLLLKAAAEGFGEDYADRAEALRELGDFYPKRVIGSKARLLVCLSCHVFQCGGLRKVGQLP